MFNQPEIHGDSFSVDVTTDGIGRGYVAVGGVFGSGFWIFDSPNYDPNFPVLDSWAVSVYRTPWVATYRLRLGGFLPDLGYERHNVCHAGSFGSRLGYGPYPLAVGPGEQANIAHPAGLRFEVWSRSQTGAGRTITVNGTLVFKP